MKMSNKKFMKIAANLGISTALLTGCISDIDESNSLATDQDTTNDVGSQKQCSSNQVDENGNECFEEIPTEGPVNHANNKDKQDTPSIENDNGWSSALVPFAAGAAGMMLANSLNKKNPGHINNNNHTYRPPMTQRPAPEAPKEHDKGRGSNTSAVTSGGGASNKGNSNKNNSINTPPSTSKNSTNDKVNLNKDSANKNNTPTPKTNNPNQSSKPSTSSKVSSGSSGIGNAKAPAGS